MENQPAARRWPCRARKLFGQTTSGAASGSSRRHWQFNKMESSCGITLQDLIAQYLVIVKAQRWDADAAAQERKAQSPKPSLLQRHLGIPIIAFTGEDFVAMLLGSDLDFAEFAVPVLVFRVIPQAVLVMEFLGDFVQCGI